MIKKGSEVEMLGEPSILEESAALADVLPSCKKRGATYRAVFLFSPFLDRFVNSMAHVADPLKF